PENGNVPEFSDTVVIIDPVCDTNNVASRITADECKEIVQLAEESWETAHFASVEDDFNLWKELFGKGFKVEDAA
ncbi:MAG TPA: nucleotidyltransferase, partial [Pseudomonas pachastrellae]|nr:nucleotidyltransferase [Halopseudomonas pachastrellae]